MSTSGILGIDPGLKGALVLLSVCGQVVLEKHVMPVNDDGLDFKGLARLFFDLSSQTEHAFLEKVHAMPKQGVVSMFSFGRTMGALEAMLAAFRIPYTLVPPATWAKHMHVGVSGKVDAKVKSKVAASRLFPREDLRATERSKIPHDGIVDAILIAEYGRRMKVPSPLNGGF